MGNSHGSMRPRRLKSGKAEEEDRKVKSYEAACCAEPELRSFDAPLRRRASLAVSAAASGVQVWSMSLRSLRGVTGCLVEMNQEVVRVVLASKHDVWGVRRPVRARRGLLRCQPPHPRLPRRPRQGPPLRPGLAVRPPPRGPSPGPAVRHARVLDALRRFKADLFTDEFFAAFQAAYRQQLAMLDRLRRQKCRLGRRLRSVRVWRRVTGVVFATIFAAILVCSVVAAARPLAFSPLSPARPPPSIYLLQDVFCGRQLLRFGFVAGVNYARRVYVLMYENPTGRLHHRRLRRGPSGGADGVRGRVEDQ